MSKCKYSRGGFFEAVRREKESAWRPACPSHVESALIRQSASVGDAAAVRGADESGAFVQTRSDEQGLVLLGEVGVGKTTLLALVRSLAERWVAGRKVVRLVTVPDFLRELRAGYDAAQQKQGEGYDALMERYQACDVLVFDDLRAEKLTDWVEEQFYLLVDYRYRQRLPVLASPNCRKEALAQRLDRRVMDRLRETCTMIEVIGPNLRDRALQRG